MSYTIKILSDREFERLPYDETEVSLGIADPRTNTAYVRHVASDELQKYLINHEFDHLIGEDKDETHLRNGVALLPVTGSFTSLGISLILTLLKRRNASSKGIFKENWCTAMKTYDFI